MDFKIVQSATNLLPFRLLVEQLSESFINLVCNLLSVIVFSHCTYLKPQTGTPG